VKTGTKTYEDYKRYQREKYATDPEWRRKRIENARRYRAEHPEKVKQTDYRKTLLRRYGLTVEQFEEMAKLQDHRCLICRNGERTLFVDHDHNSGRVRGLLCSQCNAGIGLLGDDIERLGSAIDYLRQRS